MTTLSDHNEKRRRLLQNVDGWVVLAVAALCLVGLVFIGSATADDAVFGAQQGRQALFVAVGLGVGFFVLLPHYVHILRGAWVLYGAAVLALLGLPLLVGSPLVHRIYLSRLTAVSRKMSWSPAIVAETLTLTFALTLGWVRTLPGKMPILPAIEALLTLRSHCINLNSPFCFIASISPITTSLVFNRVNI